MARSSSGFFVLAREECRERERREGRGERDLRLQFHSYQTNLLEIAVHLRRRSRSGRLAEGEAAIPFYAQSDQVIHARGCVKNIGNFAEDRRKALSAD